MFIITGALLILVFMWTLTAAVSVVVDVVTVKGIIGQIAGIEVGELSEGRGRDEGRGFDREGETIVAFGIAVVIIMSLFGRRRVVTVVVTGTEAEDDDVEEEEEDEEDEEKSFMSKSISIFLPIIFDILTLCFCKMSQTLPCSTLRGSVCIIGATYDITLSFIIFFNFSYKISFFSFASIAFFLFCNLNKTFFIFAIGMSPPNYNKIQ